MSWLTPISNIITSDTINLRDLALSVGADPAHFYVHQNLSKCNLRGQDLRGMDLTGTSITSSQIDNSTLIDKEFDPRFSFEGEYVSIRTPVELLALVYGYANEANYTYKAWAFKSLIETSLMSRHPNFSIERFIHSSDSFSKLIDMNARPSRIVKIQIYRYLQERAFKWAEERGRPLDTSIYLELMLISLLRRKMPSGNYDKYEEVVPLSLYASSRRHFKAILGRR